MEIGCHLLGNNRENGLFKNQIKLSQILAHLIIFGALVAWPVAALLPLPLGTGANESANSHQQYGGFSL